MKWIAQQRLRLKKSPPLDTRGQTKGIESSEKDKFYLDLDPGKLAPFYIDGELNPLSPDLPLPDRLYHYTSLDGLDGITKTKIFEASAIQYLNDASEYNHAVELLKNRHSRESPEGPKNFVIDIMMEKLDSFLEPFHVCVASFCQEGDLLTQWSSYQGSVSIGFDPVSIRDGFKGAFGKCLYSDGAKKVAIDDLYRILCKLVSEGSVGGDLDSITKSLSDKMAAFFNVFVVHAMFLKHAGFTEENEWRVVTIPHENDPNFDSRVTSNSVKMFYSHDFNPNVNGNKYITDIILGPTKSERLH